MRTVQMRCPRDRLVDGLLKLFTSRSVSVYEV